MWHGHPGLNQKQKCICSDIQTGAAQKSLSWDFISRRIFCQAWFQFYLPCNHAGFKEKPTGRAARSCAKRIVQLMLPKPSKITHNFHLTRRAVAWTSSSQSEAELACIWCLSSDTFRLERHRNHHLETSYQVHLLSSLVLILPALQCNHVGFKEKPTERLARSCAKRIVQLMLPKPSK